jgi:hypothetical protein
MNDKFTMSTGQAHEFALACLRNGLTGEDVKLLSSGTALSQAMNFLRNGSGATASSSLSVTANDTLESLIARGNYDWTNENIVKKFSFDTLTVGEWEFKLVDPKRDISSADAKTLCETDGWSVSKLEHLLVFGAMFPDAQKKNPIIALGSVCGLVGLQHVSELWYRSYERGLDLDWWRYSWGALCRFLAVRKVVSAT